MQETGRATRAVRYHEYGDPSVLRVEDVPGPAPKAGELLVRVRATGVHPMDWKLRAGYLKDFMPLELPHVPGYELAGTVEQLGERVTDFQPGDAVFGKGSATYAEYAVAPVATLARKPDSISFEQAATLGVSGVTAWQALFEAAQLESGQRVLVLGGAGGVGSVAVQLAHWKGAYVIATTSTANVEHVRALGADEVVDYNATAFEKAVSGVDVVLDTVGGDATSRAWDVLRPGGILVTIAGMPDEATATARGVRTSGVMLAEGSAPILQKLAELVDAGAIRPQVAETFPLHEAARAHSASQTGHGRGRRVLTVP